MGQMHVIDVDLLYDRLGQTISNSNSMYNLFIDVINGCTVYEADEQDLTEAD